MLAASSPAPVSLRMPFTAFLFAAAGLACLLGVVASVAKPAWFRFNGKVPSRWKIARLWLVLVAICTVFALVHREPSVPVAEPMSMSMDDTTTTIQVAPSADDVAQDAAMPAADAVPIDAAPPPAPPPPPPARPKRAQR
jgi:hypothetical protein